MERLDRVLVPVDFSPRTGDLLRRAFLFVDALREAPRVDVFHVWPEPRPLPPPDGLHVSLVPWAEIVEQAQEEAKRQMERLLISVNLANDPRVTRRLMTGDAARGILEIAGKEHHDLIIIGTRGRTGLAHLLLGSVAEKVLRHAPCPVLVMREK